MLRCLLIIVFYTMVQSTAIASGSYILGPGDKVEIRVFGQEDLTVETLLSDSGQINYPFFGEIKITGLTVKQVEKLIYKGLKGNYLVDPSVYVHVVLHRPFYIHGEVKLPGGYPYQPGMTVNQAIALAGGLTERASKDKIYLFKEKNKTKQINANMTYKVHAGDTILIKQRFF